MIGPAIVRGLFGNFEIFEILGIDAADIADDVSREILVGIGAKQPSLDLDAVEYIPVDRGARKFLVAQTISDLKTVELVSFGD